MKTLLILAAILPQISLASVVPCKGMAVRAAMSLYLQGGPYQGDSPVLSHKLLSVAGPLAYHGVIIDGGNDEGEYWRARFKVVTDSDQNCKVLSVKAVKKF